MKAKILIIFLFFITPVITYSQIQDGVYTNEVGQKLTISSSSETEFNFNVSWGDNDEWGCMFSAEGTATFSVPASAYYGDSSEMPSIEFAISENTITITGGYDFIGDDCAKYGDSTSEKYTVFKK